MRNRAIVLILLAGLSALFSGCEVAETSSSPNAAAVTPATEEIIAGEPASSESRAAVQTNPRLLDLGSTQCIPCRMMAPILEELREEYRGAVVIEFIDVLENPDVADAHEAHLIPTQIFFDATGAEVHRHEGFLGHDSIVAQFDAMGIAQPTAGGD